MSHYILDKAYRITDEKGVGANLVVVHGEHAGECVSPGELNARAILGITVHAQLLQNQRVAVRKAGVARVIAGSPIALGAPVICAGPSGKVMDACDLMSHADHKTLECIGFAETAATADGDVIEVFISLHQRVI